MCNFRRTEYIGDFVRVDPKTVRVENLDGSIVELLFVKGKR